MCVILKNISIIFYEKFSECEDCNIKQVVKRYFDNKDKTSIQQKYIMKRIRIN